jgi:hypothetical protein
MCRKNAYGYFDHLDAMDRVVEGPHARFRRGVHEPLDTELHCRRVHLHSVVEEGVLPQLERVEEAVRRHRPGLGGVGDELPVRRDVHEAAADVHGDPLHFVAGRGVEVEMGDLVPVGDAERAAALRGLGEGGVGDDGDHEERAQSEQERSSIHGDLLPDALMVQPGTT